MKNRRRVHTSSVPHLYLNIIEYVAGSVVHYLLKTIKCCTCLKGLISLEEKRNSLIFAKDYGGLIYPSTMVTKICKRSEQVIRSFSNSNPKTCYKDKFILITKTLSSFVQEEVFPTISSHQFDHENNHLIDLTKSVIEKYIDIRLLYLSRKSDPKNAVRRIYTKLIHFKNQ